MSALKINTNEGGNTKELPSTITYREAQLKRQAQQMYSQMKPKSYQEAYRLLFWLSLVGSVLFLGLSALTSHSYIKEIIGYSKLKGNGLLYVTIFAQMGFEAIKYGIGAVFLKNWFNLNPRRVWLLGLVFLGFSAFSTVASILGGGNAAKNLAKGIAIEQKHNAEISTIKQEIGDIKKRNSWKKRTYIAKGSADKKLLLAKEALLAKARQAKDINISRNKAKQARHSRTYRYWAACFELLFMLCIVYSYIYPKRVAFEYSQSNLEVAEQQRTDNVGATATCLHPQCNKTFKKKTENHKFCCSKHRNDYNNNIK